VRIDRYLRFDVVCNKPKICKRKSCEHNKIHTFSKKCKTKKCVFVRTEKVRIFGFFNGKKVVGKPFNHKEDVCLRPICGIKEDK
jgi:hypothetical protein